MSARPDPAGPGPVVPARPDRPGRVVLAAVVVGVLAGAASTGFLLTLEWATETHAENGWTLWLLPVGGAAMAWVTAGWGGRAARGNRLTLSQIRRLDDGVPLRMAPLVYLGTIVTHAFGGSAGREGTALQMAAGLTDGLASRTGFTTGERRLLLVASLAAGFASVFGVPWAGVVFALEIAPGPWRWRAAAAPGCVVAAVVGDRMVWLLGVHHAAYPRVTGVGLADVGTVALVAPLFGIAAWAFVRLTEAIKAGLGERVPSAALRAAVGGVAVIALTLVIGSQEYNGLSLGLVGKSFSLVEIGLGVWAIKLVMTAVTVGSGFAGGEVTPLFVIGATLGAAIGHAAGGPVVLLAAVGLVATFGAAANAPLACVVAGVELFGWSPVVALVVGCTIARLCSSNRSLYAHTADLL